MKDPKEINRVFLITVDALRADHVGCIGGGNLTPNIDKMAKNGLLFTRAARARARNTGIVWVHVANTYTVRVEEYEVQIREAAVTMSGNEAIIEALDLARSEIETARSNIEFAEDSYEQVVLPGTPLTKFSNGNNYLRIAKNNLLSAHSYLNQVYREMVSEE